jgi:hypothetical protein
MRFLLTLKASFLTWRAIDASAKAVPGQIRPCGRFRLPLFDIRLEQPREATFERWRLMESSKAQKNGMHGTAEARSTAAAAFTPFAKGLFPPERCRHLAANIVAGAQNRSTWLRRGRDIHPKADQLTFGFVAHDPGRKSNLVIRFDDHPSGTPALRSPSKTGSC